MKISILGKRIAGVMILCTVMLSGCANAPVFVDVEQADEGHVAQEQTVEGEIDITTETVPVQEEAQPVIVHVCGAVVNPGVYELCAGSRIVDAVDSAGGFLENADESYVNLAGVPADGEQIFIPTKEESVILKQTADASGTVTGKVNINTADKALLCTLPGIGDTKADSIIEYRQKHGGFSAIEDIMQVSGIKENSFQKMKERIVVN